jgi:uncharacterized protein
MELWLAIVLIVVALLVGLVLGFLIARKYMMTYLEKNPPITEDVVRTMMSQMGRTPSQKQVNQVMKSIGQGSKKAKK